MNEIQQRELNRQLFDAFMEGNVEQVEKLKNEGANILKTAEENGMTVLHLAASYGQEERVKMLIERGAHIDQEDNKGMTPLYYAAIRDQE
ncbi:ankyrin repeat domain-containing protein, partial [Wolbachia endosymbiont of Atemnus politus]|uniref:ankyrin repeat domain-containing protein n=1 Tax=Wolbachia endosymbiont of Atemnus politus TaxID=2682840 RepID=UPI001572A3D7